MSAPFSQMTPEQAKASLLANTQTGSFFDLPNVGRFFRDVANAGQWALPYLGAATLSAPAYTVGAAKYGVPEARKGYRQGGILGALGGLNEAARKVPVIGNASVNLMDAATQYAEDQGASGPAMFLADMLAPDPTGKIGALAGGAAALAKGMGGLNLAVLPAFIGSPRQWSMNDELGRLTTRYDKINTGEGAQAYGYGNYSAENPGVAGSYAKGEAGNLRWRDKDVDSLWTVEIEERHADALAGMDDHERDMMTYVLAETSQMDSLEQADELMQYSEAADVWRKYRHEFADPPEPDPAIYGVLHDVEPEELVDWDAPLQDLPKEQLFSIDRIWRNVFPDSNLLDPYSRPVFNDLTYGSTHRAILERLVEQNPGTPLPELNKRISEMLSAEGFKGTQFYDGNSRRHAPFKIQGVTPETHEIGKQAGSNVWGFYDKESGFFDADLPTFSNELDAQRALDGDYELFRNYVMFGDDLTYVDPSRTDADLIGDMPVGAPYRTVDDVPNVGTMFSGVGTMEGALGPHNSRFAAEYDPDIASAFNDAHGTSHEARNVFDVDPSEVKGNDLFHASPVCKNLSRAKSGRNIDEFDQKSADKISQVVNEARPPSVTIENVPDYQNTVLFDEIMDSLDAQDYDVDVQVVNPADYGGAQHRPRLLIRASRDGAVPDLPEKTGPSDWFATVEDLIEDAPDLPFRGKTKGDEGWEIKRIRQDIADGRLDPSKPIITMGGSADSKHAYAANAGGASPTITSTAGSVPRIFMPDGRVKRVTGRMLARLMGLPDDFKIPDNWGQAKKVLGNGIHGEITRQMIKPMAEQGQRFNR